MLFDKIFNKQIKFRNNSSYIILKKKAQTKERLKIPIKYKTSLKQIID